MARANFILLVFFSLGLLMIAGRPALSAPDSLYTITDIKVDVTADNAARAREKAFYKAQMKAFQTLINQLLSPAELETFEMPDSATITSLLKDFEVTDEQLSSVRHIGTYTVRFNKRAVREYLETASVSYTDIGRKPLLILPYYQKGTEFVLWDEENPWLQAWRQHKSYRGLVPVTVPIGDLQDVGDVSSREPMSYDREKLENLALRYGAGGVLIMLASPEQNSRDLQQIKSQPESLTVSIYRTDQARPVLSRTVDVNRVGESGDVFKEAVQKTHRTLEEEWKRQTLVSVDQNNSLRARVRFDDMPQWIDTQKALKTVAGVETIELISLRPGQAEIEIIFHGAERRLRLALAQADITLTTPRVAFGRAGYGRFGSSPLIYDLYLNKYKPGEGIYDDNKRRRAVP